MYETVYSYNCSPDWPLANAESPVPHPLKNGEVFTMHEHCVRTLISVRTQC